MRYFSFVIGLFCLLLAPITFAEKKPTIVALAPHVVEMLYAIGAGDQIIGTTDHADYPEAAKAIPRIGNYARIQIEAVTALQPELIIAWRSGSPSDDLARLKNLGFTIAYSQPEQLTDVAKELRYFGKLTGHQKRAEQLAAQYEHQLTQLIDRFSARKPISVFYELWPLPLTTVANNAWPQQAIAVCKIDNPFVNAANDYPQINLEQVLVANPAIIIQPKSAGEKNKDAVNWSQWQTLSAIQNKTLLSPNADQLHRMTPRVLPEIEKLCQDIDKIRLKLN